MEGVELPREPKGDCSELANAARLDAAKADDDVTALGFDDSSSFDFAAPIAPNGETDDGFVNALVTGACQAHQLVSLRNTHTALTVSFSLESSVCLFFSGCPSTPDFSVTASSAAT